MRNVLLFLLLLLPIASASISTISMNQNLYPGSHFNITINNDSPPTFINITANNPCITQKSLLMRVAIQNLTVSINKSIPPGSYSCNFILSYNGTLTIVNPASSGSGGAIHTTTTSIIPASSSTIIQTTSTTEESTSTTEQPATVKTEIQKVKEFDFWAIFKYIILPLLLVLAVLRFVAHLREKKIPGL